MPVWEMPPVTAEELAALERDYRYGEGRLVRQRSQIVRLAYELETQVEIARAVRCSTDTVRRALALYREGGRAALRRRNRPGSHAGRTGLGWQRELAGAMRRGPQACGVLRPAWTAPLLAAYLAERTGVAVSERTVRRGLDLLGYVCRRPTWTVRHKAEAEADYPPKAEGSRRS
jgi:transposase